jgi:hypothetical protein
VRRPLPPRLRTPVRTLVAGTAVLIAGGVRYGWADVAYLAPVVLGVAAGYYVLGGRDSDLGDALRGQADERQALQRLKVQALTGRVMALAAVVAYIAATLAKATLWPYEVLIALVGASFFAGKLIYGERGGKHGEEGDARQPGAA